VLEGFLLHTQTRERGLS